MFGVLLIALCFAGTPVEETFTIPFCLPDGTAQEMFVRHVSATGDGPPIVLLHFASGHSGRMIPLARRLAERGHPTYAADLLGHGLSSKGEPVYDDTILGVRKLAEILVEKHGWPEVGLAGTSMGAEIAIHYALKQEREEEARGERPLIGSIVAQGVIAPWQRDVALAILPADVLPLRDRAASLLFG
ncbi:MAG: alpha/beta fold hydrolase [Planctomycetota bacterium]